MMRDVPQIERMSEVLPYRKEKNFLSFGGEKWERRTFKKCRVLSASIVKI